MKKQLFILSLFTLFFCFIAPASFAQRTAGGSTGGATPTSFTVTVGTDIILFLDQATPTSFPVLTAVSYRGVITTINGDLSQLMNLGFNCMYQVFGAYSSCSTRSSQPQETSYSSCSSSSHYSEDD